MRSWKIGILYMFLSLSMIACSKPKFGLDEEARGKLSQMRGYIQVKFVSDKLWQYSIVNGELLLESVENWAPGSLEKRPYIYLPKEAPMGLPQIQGFEYHGPYSLSPDKTLMVLSISLPTKGASMAENFVIIQTDKKELLFQRRSENRYRVEDIAWSPDSSMFVVLEKSSRRNLSISGILYILLAHPSDIYTFYLSIYDRKGTFLVHAKVASGLVDGGGHISWREKGKAIEEDTRVSP
jgi:hypothetical protein